MSGKNLDLDPDPDMQIISGSVFGSDKSPPPKPRQKLYISPLSRHVVYRLILYPFLTEEEKDVGVGIHQTTLNPGEHCRKAANNAMEVLKQIIKCFHYRMEVLKQIIKCFHYRDKNTFQI